MNDVAVSAGTGTAEGTGKVTRIPLAYPDPTAWGICFAGALLLLGLFVVSATWLFARGVGVWGVNIPVNWGLAISNYIWFLGIGHAGTLISAMLLLLNEHWQNGDDLVRQRLTPQLRS